MIKNLKIFLAVRENFNNFFLVLKETFHSFEKNNDFEAAASLSYYSFLALIPLLLMAVYPLGSFLITSQSAVEGIERLFPTLFPKINRAILKEVQTLGRYRGWWEVFTFITFLGFIIPFAKACRNIFSRIFKFERRLSFLKAKLWDGLGGLIILAIFILLVLSELMHSLLVGPLLIDLPTVLEVGYLFVPFFMALIVLFFFFLFFVPVKVKWLYLLTGSLVTVFLWSLIRPVFSLILRVTPHYGFTFGSFRALFFLVIWVYYSFAAILVGAEFIANMKRKEALLFKGLFFNPKAGWRIPKRFIKSFGPGEIVFEEGEIGGEMYYILSGALSVSKRGKVIRIIKENDYFGEIAMLLESERTATVTVIAPDTRLISISRDNFETLLRENPEIVLAILKEMSARLKSIDDDTSLMVL